MASFNEVWLEDQNIRIARLRMTSTMHHGSRFMLATDEAPRLGQTPIPASARDIRPSYRRETMQAGIRRVVDPQRFIDNFEMDAQTDRYERDRDIRDMREIAYIIRTVATVELTTPVTLASIIQQMQRWSRFFENHGWIPEDPQTIYEQWCEDTGVQPVASDIERYPVEASSIRRLGQMFRERGVALDHEQAERISNRMHAASATQNAYMQGMHALGQAVMDWRPHVQTIAGRPAAPTHQMIRDWLDADQIADLRVYDIVHRRDSAAVSTAPFTDPFQPRPPQQSASVRDVPQDVVAQIRAATAAIPGVRLPTTVAGKRPLNLESPDEICDTLDTPDRVHASRSGSREGDAGGARRTLRLDD